MARHAQVILQADKTNVYAFGYEPFSIPNSQQTSPNYQQQCFDGDGSRLEYGGYAFLCIIYIYDPNLTDIERRDLNFRLYNEEPWDCYQNKVILCHVHQYTKDPYLPGNIMGSPEYTQCHENLNQLPPNNPPIVIITSDPDPVIRITQVTLNDIQSYDPDQGDQIVEYQWEILDDAGYNIVLSNPSS